MKFIFTKFVIKKIRAQAKDLRATTTKNINLRFNLKGLVLISLSIVLFNSENVICQDDTTEYKTEEIIVTGTRTEQKVIDIPYSVQRIDQSTWKSSRKIGINDILTSIPGLFLQSRYGNHDVRVTIRGFGSRSNSGIRGVRILLDGIPESEPDGQTRVEALDFTSIGRIEVVKGNSSSLYTNSPGGVINFMSDKYFPRTFVLTANEFGSFDLRKNGLKFGLTSRGSVFMATGSYENYKGYRNHSRQYQTRISTFFETEISKKSLLSIYGYYVNGYLELPGSLTLTDYILNDTAANSTDLDRHTRRITKKGRLGITFNTKFGKNDNNIFEVTAYGTIKDLERIIRTYRIFSRSGIGASFRYINKLKILKRNNEFSLGGDLYYQTGPIEEFNSILGAKGDELQTLFDESISNAGFYALERFSIIKDRLDLLLTGRYDRVIFNSRNLLQSELDTSRVFAKFTPKAALSLKLNPRIAMYASYGLSFDSPAFNEMDNYRYTSNPNVTLNPDIEPQKSQNIEIGIKGNLPPLKKKYFKNTFAEITFFRSKIEDEIVPFTVANEPLFRNAANSKRMGFEIGITTEPIEGLNIKTAYTYSDFKYEKYLAGTIDINGVLTNQDFSGNIMPSIPKNLSSSDISYQYTFQKNYNVFIKLHHEFIDRMFVNDKNDDSLMTERYNLFNAQLGVNLQFKNFTLLAYGGFNNIANKKYVSFIQINSDDRHEYYEAGASRNFFGGLTIGYIFKK